MTRTLVVRLDATGDVLLAGPAVRAVAAGSGHVTLLCGPRGAEAGRLLPGVDDVMVWECPWIEPDPRPVATGEVDTLVGDLRRRGFDRALVLTSFHQSPLPTALVLRLAGVPWVAAISEDYPGSLLDLRHLVPDAIHEADRALSLAVAAGFALPAGDHGPLAVRHPLPDVGHLLPSPDPVVLHPGTSVPARAWPVERYADLARVLTDRGHDVVVTGGPSERMLTRSVVGDTPAHDLGGRTSLPELAAVLAAASVVVVGNTGPAHLAAAVGSPVVSLFAPTVPAVRWAPYRVPTVLLGDQHAPCRATRVPQCPFPGHPCLTSVTADEVLRAVEQLCGSKQPTVVGSSTRSTA
jgi:ADP-heptose:LPS heptosyltransferase